MLEETFANVVVIETIVSGSSDEEVDVEGGDHRVLDTHEQLIVNPNVVQLLQVTIELMSNLNTTPTHLLTTTHLHNTHHHLQLCRYLLIHIIQQAVRLIPPTVQSQQCSMLPMLLSSQLCYSLYQQLVTTIQQYTTIISTTTTTPTLHRDIATAYEEYCQEIYTLLFIYQMEQLYQLPSHIQSEEEEVVIAGSYISELPGSEINHLVEVLIRVVVGRDEQNSSSLSTNGTSTLVPPSAQTTRPRSSSIGQWLASAASQPLNYVLNNMPAVIQNLQHQTSVSPLVMRSAMTLTLLYHSESPEVAAAVHSHLQSLSASNVQQILQTVITKNLLSNSSSLHFILPFIHILLLSNPHTIPQLVTNANIGSILLHALAIDLCHLPQDCRYHRTMMSLMVLQQILAQSVDPTSTTQLLTLLHQHTVPRPKAIPHTSLPKSVTSLTVYQLLTHTLVTMLQSNSEPHRYKLLTTTYGVQLLGSIIHRLMVDLIPDSQQLSDDERPVVASNNNRLHLRWIYTPHRHSPLPSTNYCSALSITCMNISHTCL